MIFMNSLKTESLECAFVGRPKIVGAGEDGEHFFNRLLMHSLSGGRHRKLLRGFGADNGDAVLVLIILVGNTAVADQLRVADFL
jgi:hypothetical protein